MKRVLIFVLALVCILSSIGCASPSASKYEMVVDRLCQALEKGDTAALTALMDMNSIQQMLEARYSNKLDSASAIEDAMELYTQQLDFSHLYDDLQYMYGNAFVVEHGTLYPDDDAQDLALYQRLRKLSNDEESLTLMEFVNSFVDSVTDIKVVDTTIIFRSQDGKDKDRYDVRFYMYQVGKAWYLDYISLYDIETPDILEYVLHVLNKRGAKDAAYPSDSESPPPPELAFEEPAYPAAEPAAEAP